MVNTLKRVESFRPKERSKEDIKALERVKSLLSSNQSTRDMPQVDTINRNLGLSDFGIDTTEIPNVRILYDQNTKAPAYYENSLGQRVPYGNKLTKKFQYPGTF